VRRRPVQDVRIWGIQNRPTKRKPHGVRWVVDGEPHSLWFVTATEADRYRSRLLIARQDGEWFDRRHGEPVTWRPSADEQQVHAWVREWLAEEWGTWAPKTRKSEIAALVRFVPLVCDPKATDPPAGLRPYLKATLPPSAEVDEQDPCERWLGRWCLTLAELNEDVLAEVDRRLGLGDQGQPLAPSTAGRNRKIARASIRRAVERKKIPANPWPPTPKGRSRRKAARQRRTVDVKRLPEPQTMAAILIAIPSHQPGSHKYQVMTAITYYAGLRPGEVVMLRPRALRLSAEGWGHIDVDEADVDFDQPGEPKTGPRQVPIPPVLVDILRRWLGRHAFGPNDLIFRTRNGNRPAESNWNRALARACRQVGYHKLSPYDGRHACATLALRAGTPLRETARRMGHTVETLVTYYVGALQGDDDLANERIDATFAGHVGRSLVGWLCSSLW
jgi:integrase